MSVLRYSGEGVAPLVPQARREKKRAGSVSQKPEAAVSLIYGGANFSLGPVTRELHERWGHGPVYRRMTKKPLGGMPWNPAYGTL